jgi:large subunit ribosomal protein L28e
MSNASADLVWELVGKNNKFLQKRGDIRLSSDPFNNTGKATKRHAGFINAKAAVVKIKKEKEVIVVSKDGTNTNKPRKQWVKKAFGAKASDSAKGVAAVRPDLADVAFRRARKLSITAARTAKVRAARAKAVTQVRKALDKKKGGYARTSTRKREKKAKKATKA